ncbi:MAG: PAS domain S-box protein, partial [Chloroflexales bacterium]
MHTRLDLSPPRRSFLVNPLVWLPTSLLIGLAVLSFVLIWHAKSQQLGARLLVETSEMTRVLQTDLAEHEQARMPVRDVQVSSLVESALRELTPHDIALYVFDVSGAQPRLLAFYPSRSAEQSLPAGAPPDMASLEVAPYTVTHLAFEGRTWRIVARPGPAYVAETYGWDAWVHLLIGLTAAGAYCLSMDTRRRAEAKLHQSEATYRLISEHAVDVIWILDLESQHFTYVSPSVEKLRGYTPHEVAQQTMAETLTPASLQKVLALMAERPPSVELPPSTDELDQIHKDGRIVSTEVTTTYVRNDAGRLQVVGVSRDITMRKQAEARLKTLNRTYALLSAINQVIVRVREPQELFAAACQIAVTQGAFRLAWIGLFDPQTKTVRPVAHAGEASDYVENLHIRLDDSACGQGPIATAIRLGTHVVANNIGTDTRMNLSRGDALRLGYRSAAAFPLIVAGEMWGTLNLYASEPDFFDEDELTLLDGLATDIAFALEFMRQEAQRQRAEEHLRASERHSQLLIEAMPDMMFRMTPEGVILDYSAKAGLTFYVPPAAFVGRSAFSVLPPVVAEQVQHAIQQAFATGHLQTFEYQLTVEAKLLSYEARIVTNANENEAVAIIRDITTRKQTEHDLQERIKELTCLRQVQSLIETNPALDDLCQQVVAYLVAAMQFPDVTVVQIDLDGRHYRSAADHATMVNTIATEIMGGEAICGRLSVAYRDGTVPIHEEQTLLDGVAHSLGLWFERQQAEAALRASEARYRLLAENTSDVIWQLDVASGYFTYVSPSVQRLTGYTAAEVLSRPLRAIVTAESAQMIAEKFQHHVIALQANHGSIYEEVNEVYHPHRDGHIVPTEAVTMFMRDAQTGTMMILGVSRDISARKQAEAALKESEARYRVIFEGASEGIVAARIADRSFQYVNPTLCAMFGYTRDEFLRLGINDMYPNETQPRV